MRNYKMNSRLQIIIIVVLLCGTLGCRRYNTQSPGQDTALATERAQKETLVHLNQQLVEKDASTIADYAQQNGWEMQTTQSGLWYMLYQNGQGEKAATGKIAEMNYSISLLDGTVCYSSDKLGTKSFRLGEGVVNTGLGMSAVEPGLEEGVLLMRVGDKARFIMPPHLAHGLSGDGGRIPKRTIILYDVELLSLK